MAAADVDVGCWRYCGWLAGWVAFAQNQFLHPSATLSLPSLLVLALSTLLSTNHTIAIFGYT